MDQHFLLYALVLAAVIAGILVVKKVASCLVKTIVLLVLLAVLAFAYYAYF